MSGDDLIGELTRWLAEARVDAAAESRARERWLRQQSGEEARFAGVLLDLAERGDVVSVHTLGGRRLRGRVRAVADDFCALRGADGTDVLLRYDGVAAVRGVGDGHAPVGDRPAALDMTFAEALLAVAAERPRAMVRGVAGEGTVGELRSVGRDVLTLREGSGVAYVPLASVVEVALVG